MGLARWLTSSRKAMTAEGRAKPTTKKRAAFVCFVALLVTGVSTYGCGAGDSSGQLGPTASVTAASGTSTTSGQAQTTISAETTEVVPVKKLELKWGETATVEGGTITVEEPVADPTATVSHAGSVVVRCQVAFVNIGQQLISYAPQDFTLMASASGSNGISTQPSQGELRAGTLSPGQSVEGTVRFQTKENDAPISVSIMVPWLTDVQLVWR